MDSNKNNIESIGITVFLKMFLRSFFNQGSFSFKYRQNIGFAYCIEPIGKVLWKDKEKLKDFYLRHLEHYNGNPFMVTLVLGAVTKMEERFRNNDGITEQDIIRFKKAVGPAIGSAGDRFFWSTLRPFGLILSLLLLFLYNWWGILFFLGIFNIPTIILRWYWLNAGYRLGPKIVIEIVNKKRENAIKYMEILGATVLSFFSVIYLFSPDNFKIGVTGSILLMFFISLLMIRKNISFLWVVLTSIIISFFLGILVVKIHV